MNTACKLGLALASALWMTTAIGAPPPASSGSADSAQARPEASGHASKSNLMKSGAMHDALGVAMQAFGLAAVNPDATESQKQAAANHMMQNVFQRELHGGAGSAQSDAPKASTPAPTDVPTDAVRRAGYEASRAFHEDPNSQATADAVRRLILTADGKLPPAKPAQDDGQH
jgi:hypothetical protein